MKNQILKRLESAVNSSSEMADKIDQAANAEELEALMGDLGRDAEAVLEVDEMVDLRDEQLDSVAGGCFSTMWTHVATTDPGRCCKKESALSSDLFSGRKYQRESLPKSWNPVMPSIQSPTPPIPCNPFLSRHRPKL